MQDATGDADRRGKIRAALVHDFEMQGYLFARPVPLAGMIAALDARSTARDTAH